MFKRIKNKIVCLAVSVCSFFSVCEAKEVEYQTSQKDLVQALEYLGNPKESEDKKSNYGFEFMSLFGIFLGTLGGLYLNDKKFFKASSEIKPWNHPKTEPPSLNKFFSQQPLQLPLLINEKEMEQKFDVKTPKERQELADWLWAVKKLEEIKKERAILTRKMAHAKKKNDLKTMEKIQVRRLELKNERKKAYLRATSPKMDKIKEKRRLLTKQMTLARRQKNTQRMDKITTERFILKQQVKAIGRQVRNFCYSKERARLLEKN